MSGDGSCGSDSRSSASRSCCCSSRWRTSAPSSAPWRYDQLDFNAFLEPPGGTHWFGTTQNGFDMFALTMRGMQKSLVIGLLGALISTALAAMVGAFAGYFGGAVNTALVDAASTCCWCCRRS